MRRFFLVCVVLAILALGGLLGMGCAHQDKVSREIASLKQMGCFGITYLGSNGRLYKADRGRATVVKNPGNIERFSQVLASPDYIFLAAVGKARQSEGGLADHLFIYNCLQGAWAPLYEAPTGVEIKNIQFDPVHRRLIFLTQAVDNFRSLVGAPQHQVVETMHAMNYINKMPARESRRVVAEIKSHPRAGHQTILDVIQHKRHIVRQLWLHPYRDELVLRVFYPQYDARPETLTQDVFYVVDLKRTDALKFPQDFIRWFAVDSRAEMDLILGRSHAIRFFLSRGALSVDVAPYGKGQFKSVPVPAEILAQSTVGLRRGADGDMLLLQKGAQDWRVYQVQAYPDAQALVSQLLVVRPGAGQFVDYVDAFENRLVLGARDRAAEDDYHRVYIKNIMEAPQRPTISMPSVPKVSLYPVVSYWRPFLPSS